MCGRDKGLPNVQCKLPSHHSYTQYPTSRYLPIHAIVTNRYRGTTTITIGHDTIANIIANIIATIATAITTTAATGT